MYRLWLDRPRRKHMATATYRHLDLAHDKVRGGEHIMLSAPMAPLPTKKRTRSPMALHVNSMGPVDIQAKTMHVERDRQSVHVVLELLYGRHEADSNRATRQRIWPKVLGVPLR